MKTFEIDGYEVTVTAHADEHMGEPWKEHDGHGIVRESRGHHPGSGNSTKRPGELVLSSDRGFARFYDYAATLKLARKDKWGLCPEHVVKLAQKIGRQPTAREITAASVLADFEHLRAWCNDEWQWQGFTTEIIAPDGGKVDGESVWGYDDGDYMMEEAESLARSTVASLIETARETAMAECYP